MSQIANYVHAGAGGLTIETINNIPPNGAGNFTLAAGAGITLTPGTNTITITSTSASDINVIDGDVGSVTGITVTFTGGTSGAVFTGVGTTMTESFNFLALPGTNAGGTQGYISFGGTPFIHEYGDNNIFIGASAGNFTLNPVTAADNIGIGASALDDLTTGFQNTALGIGSLDHIATSNNNTAIGYHALNQLEQGFPGAWTSNVALGASSGFGLEDGNQNTFLGTLSAENVVSGSNNIAIGYNSATAYTTTESSNIIIGNVGTIAESNVLRIGTQGSGAGQQNTCYIAGITGVTTSNSNMVTIDTTSGQLGAASIPVSITWSVITANQTAAINNGYICNKASTLTLALPATSAVGSIIEVTGINTATGWQITQASGQQIFFGTSSTTLGATGTLTSSAIRDSIRMVCVVANTTWNVVSAVGNITVA